MTERDIQQRVTLLQVNYGEQNILGKLWDKLAKDMGQAETYIMGKGAQNRECMLCFHLWPCDRTELQCILAIQETWSMSIILIS